MFSPVSASRLAGERPLSVRHGGDEPGLALLFQSITVALDHQRVTVMEQAIEPTPRCTLRESDDRCDSITRRRRQRGVQLSTFDIDRTVRRPRRVVSEASQYALWATQNLHALGFTPLDSLTSETQGELCRTSGK